MRLTVVTLILAMGGGCGWFAGSVDPGSSGPSSTQAEPARAVCRPLGTDTRGAAPLAVGDTFADGWKVSEADETHREYARYTLTQGESTTAIEIRFHEGEPGDWTTERTRLMPAPEQEPPQPLLEALIAHLRTFDAAHAGDPPFLTRTEGVQDPFAGLPPCEEGQDPWNGREPPELGPAEEVEGAEEAGKEDPSTPDDAGSAEAPAQDDASP